MRGIYRVDVYRYGHGMKDTEDVHIKVHAESAEEALNAGIAEYRRTIAEFHTIHCELVTDYDFVAGNVIKGRPANG